MGNAYSPVMCHAYDKKNSSQNNKESRDQYNMSWLPEN